jgi:hypothetical protein
MDLPALVVYGNDHHGHGRTAPSPKYLGDFGPGGFNLLVEDMVRLSLITHSTRSKWWAGRTAACLLSFGTCSITEPVGDLVTLGLLGKPLGDNR